MGLALGFFCETRNVSKIDLFIVFNFSKWYTKQLHLYITDCLYLKIIVFTIKCVKALQRKLQYCNIGVILTFDPTTCFPSASTLYESVQFFYNVYNRDPSSNKRFPNVSSFTSALHIFAEDISVKYKSWELSEGILPEQSAPPTGQSYNRGPVWNGVAVTVDYQCFIVSRICQDTEYGVLFDINEQRLSSDRPAESKDVTAAYKDWRNVREGHKDTEEQRERERGKKSIINVQIDKTYVRNTVLYRFPSC